MPDRIALGLVLMLAWASAHAANFVVTSVASVGENSLGDALAQANASPRSCWMDVQLPISTVTGPPFYADPFDPSQVVETEAGSITITFTNGNAATYGCTIGNVHQVKPIARQGFAEPGTACQ